MAQLQAKVAISPKQYHQDAKKLRKRSKARSIHSETQDVHEEVASELLPLIELREMEDRKPSAADRHIHFAWRNFKDSSPILSTGADIAAYSEILASALPNISPPASSLAVEYIAQLCQMSGTKVPWKSIRCVYLVALTIAHKFIDDNTYPMSTIAHAGGVYLKELVLYEQWFVLAMSFRLATHHFARNEDRRRHKDLVVQSRL